MDGKADRWVVKQTDGWLISLRWLDKKRGGWLFRKMDGKEER